MVMSLTTGGPGGISTATLGGGGPPPEEEGAAGLDVAAKEGAIMASPAEASGQTPSLTDHQVRSHIQSQTIGNNLTESSVLHSQGEGGADPIASKVEVPPEAPPPTVLALQRNEGEGSGGVPEDPKISVFLQTASFLLDVHALKFAEMSLSHIRASPSPPPPLYHILEARLYLHRNEPHRALDCLTAALQLDVQVRLPPYLSPSLPLSLPPYLPPSLPPYLPFSLLHNDLFYLYSYLSLTLRDRARVRGLF